MNYLLDICALSEMIKKEPNAGFAQWIEQQTFSSLFVSVILIAEIEQGIVRLSNSRKKRRLRTWISGIKKGYGSRLLPIDLAVAETYGQIQGTGMKAGKPLPVQDCWIAATGIAHSLAVVTCDDVTLATTGVTIVNPWRRAN